MRTKKSLHKVPESPGVYVFRDRSGRVIYVGKAVNLRERLRTYFGPAVDDRTMRLGREIFSFEVTPVGSEGEALLLEAALIKKHQPRFNVNLKDDKTYPFVKLTREKYPSLQVVREKKQAGAEYFGPFTDVQCLRRVLRFIRTFYPVRTCRGALAGAPRRPCTAYYLRRCPAPCAGRIAPAAYRKSIEGLRSFLAGRYRQYRGRLKAQMDAAVARWDFERAKVLAERMSLLERMEKRVPWRKEEELLEYRRKNVLPRLGRVLGLSKIPAVIEGYDISNLGGTFSTGSRVVFRGGVPGKDGYRKFRIRNGEGIDDYRMMREILRRRFSKPEHGEEPDLIVIDGGIGHLHEAAAELRSLKVKTPVIALAKREERVFTESAHGSLELPYDSPELQLLQHVRDEAHRFARGYHLRLRRKHMVLPDFRGVSGIGPVRRRIIVDILADSRLKEFPGEKLLAARIPAAIVAQLRESFSQRRA